MTCLHHCSFRPYSPGGMENMYREPNGNLDEQGNGEGVQPDWHGGEQADSEEAL